MQDYGICSSVLKIYAKLATLIKLLISENRTLTLILHHFAKCQVNGAKLCRFVEKYMLNKKEKFDIKVFFCCINIAIFVLGYFSESPSRHATRQTRPSVIMLCPV